MDEKMITALMVAPGDHPVVTVLCCCKTFLDLAVSFGAGEPCEVSFFPLTDDAGILYNREAIFYGLKGNRRIGRRILAGVFYVVGIKDGKLSSLPFAELEAYFERFWEPEHFTKAEVEEACFADLRNDILDLEKTYFQD